MILKLSSVAFLIPTILSVTAALEWKPKVPCKAPSGITNPAVDESMCFKEFATTADGTISIREMGLPLNETLIENEVISSDWASVLGYGVQNIISYFSGDNGKRTNILDARTVPITIRTKNNITWVIGMMISTSLYPDVTTIPAPILPVQMSNIGHRYIAVKQLNTTGFPTEGSLDIICDDILNSPLPTGYSVNLTSPWTPTIALYNGEQSSSFSSECWVEVTRR